MQTPAPSLAPLKFCFIIVFTFTLNSALAQEGHYRDPQDPTKGHWQLFTDATTLTTSIKFFDGQNHLLYEEVMPRKYIKLTKRNINQINLAFDLVTQNNLIRSKVKANPLLSIVSRPPSNFNQTKDARDYAGGNIKLNTYKITNTAKFYLAFQNPDRNRLKIYIMNEAKQIIYDERTNITNYKRRYNFSGLHAGMYTLVLTTDNRKFRYTEQILIGPTNKTWQPEKPAPALITSKE